MFAKNIAITEQEYLQDEQISETKHDFLQGKIWGKTVGASDNHVSIALNLASLLIQLLKGFRCKTCISDMKIKIALANAFFYPDVLIICREALNQFVPVFFSAA